MVVYENMLSPFFWLALWLAGFQIAPGPRPEAPPARGSISGIVVRAGAAATGVPPTLADATVELKPGNVSVVTGAGGAFTFRNLPPGRYTLSFTRDGFVPQEDPRRSITPTGFSITLGAGQILKDIELPMVPAPFIAGKVFDPYGEPLAAALVRAYMRMYTPFGTQLRSVKKAMTNDMGEFRLFGLTYGSYLVSAGYGDRDRAAAIGKTQLSANVSKADDGYATVFFDGAEDLTRARAARLAPGADPGALNIFLRDSARFKIRGQVLPVVSGTKIVLAPKGSDLADADYFIQPNASGAFEIRGISPGAYFLLATAADDALSSEVVGVTVVDRDIDRVPLTLQETVAVSGQLILEGARGAARPSLSDVRIRLLRSSIEFDQKVDAAVDPDGRFTLRPVAPLAEYDIVVDPLPAETYVRSITSGGVNILRGNARLLPFQPLRIALAPADEALEVHVYNGADAVAGAQVVLVPDLLMRRRADRYVVGFTGENGNVSLAAVAPGRYTAYAFERLEPGAYYALGYDPAAAKRFSDHAVPVTVGEGGTRPIQLRVIPAAETAGGFQ